MTYMTSGTVATVADLRAEVAHLTELDKALRVHNTATYRDWNEELAALPAGTRTEVAIEECQEALREARGNLARALKGEN